MEVFRSCSSSALAVLTALWTMACDGKVEPPPRPTNVPTEAVWAGGADGGDWFACRLETGARYDCSIYSDHDGVLNVRGTFVRIRSGAPEPSDQLAFTGAFLGDRIPLEDEASLVPDGVIEFPFSSTHGKRQEYKLGKEVGAEQTYGEAPKQGQATAPKK